MPRIRAESIEAHKHLTRREIVEAAHHLFVHRGFAKTSISEVADHVGVARTTVYEYFPNKEALLLGVVSDVVEPAVEHLLASRPVDDDTVLVITGMLDQLVHYAAGNSTVALTLLRAGRKLHKRAQDEMWQVLQPYADVLEDLCRRGVEAGRLPHQDPVSLARILSDLFLGAVDEVLRAPDPPGAAAGIVAEREVFLERALRS